MGDEQTEARRRAYAARMRQVYERQGPIIGMLIAAFALFVVGVFVVGVIVTHHSSATAPAPAPTSKPAVAYYRVQSGNTLSLIAKEYDVSVQTIINANHIANANKISIGELLAIPGGHWVGAP